PFLFRVREEKVDALDAAAADLRPCRVSARTIRDAGLTQRDAPTRGASKVFLALPYIYEFATIRSTTFVIIVTSCGVALTPLRYAKSAGQGDGSGRIELDDRDKAVFVGAPTLYVHTLGT